MIPGRYIDWGCGNNGLQVLSGAGARGPGSLAPLLASEQGPQGSGPALRKLIPSSNWLEDTEMGCQESDVTIHLNITMVIIWDG